MCFIYEQAENIHLICARTRWVDAKESYFNNGSFLPNSIQSLLFLSHSLIELDSCQRLKFRQLFNEATL